MKRKDETMQTDYMKEENNCILRERKVFRDALESVLVLCAEGREFYDSAKLLKAIEHEASEAIRGYYE